MKREVVVVGLGYIGLPTAVVLANSGWQVTGVDVSDRTIEFVQAGQLPFVEEGLEVALAAAVNAGTLTAQKDTPPAEIYILSVPSPLTGDNQLETKFIDAATDAIIPQLRGGELLLLESTVPPGTTERMADRVLAARPELRTDESTGKPGLFFAHAPERVLPGRVMIEMRTNDRVVGGTTPEATDKAAELYRSFCTGKVILSDARTAEMSKLAENAYRDINIAYANELSVICDELGIDVWELIELANRHPRVDILKPGPGVGGHCIAVDPWFIVASTPTTSKLIKQAREVNDGKPHWVLSKIDQAVQSAPTPPTIALLGLAFKPNIDDLRESPALQIASAVAQRYPEHRIMLVEPNITEPPTEFSTHAHVEFAHAKAAIDSADIIVLLVAHDEFGGLELLTSSDKVVLDTTGMWRDPLDALV